MSTNLSTLSQKSLVLIFTYAPAGLGHLRVTDALYDGLPKEVLPILLGSQDKSISILHRFSSIHPVARSLMEWTQRGTPENLFTYYYRRFLRFKTKLLYQQMVTILDQRIDVPKTVLVVSTHFGLAHQLAAIKDRLGRDRRVKVILVVQVTDDSPQHIWYVPGADTIFVPSQRTKAGLLAYGKKARLPEVKFEVTPYPISPIFGNRLSPVEFQERLHQLDRLKKSSIHVAVPISGAAVGMGYITKLIDTLYQKSQRFVFHVVSKSTSFTQPFLNRMLERSFVNLYISTRDKEVVDKYEEIYQKVLISLEVTKPSEQSFKALVSPMQRGGSIVLFSCPVGRQEYDNLDFLRRHSLIPFPGEQKFLWDLFDRDLTLKKVKDKKLLKNLNQWRGLILPDDPEKAAGFIWWCVKESVFTRMVTQQASELGFDGVKKFWQKVAELLKEL